MNKKAKLHLILILLIITSFTLYMRQMRERTAVAQTTATSPQKQISCVRGWAYSNNSGWVQFLSGQDPLNVSIVPKTSFDFTGISWSSNAGEFKTTNMSLREGSFSGQISNVGVGNFDLSGVHLLQTKDGKRLFDGVANGINGSSDKLYFSDPAYPKPFAQAAATGHPKNRVELTINCPKTDVPPVPILPPGSVPLAPGTPPSGCSSTCTSGSKRCNDNKIIATCKMGTDGCLSYVPTDTCTGDNVCVAGYCMVGEPAPLEVLDPDISTCKVGDTSKVENGSTADTCKLFNTAATNPSMSNIFNSVTDNMKWHGILHTGIDRTKSGSGSGLAYDHVYKDGKYVFKVEGKVGSDTYKRIEQVEIDNPPGNPQNVSCEYLSNINDGLTSDLYFEPPLTEADPNNKYAGVLVVRKLLLKKQDAGQAFWFPDQPVDSYSINPSSYVGYDKFNAIVDATSAPCQIDTSYIGSKQRSGVTVTERCKYTDDDLQASIDSLIGFADVDPANIKSVMYALFAYDENNNYSVPTLCKVDLPDACGNGRMDEGEVCDPSAEGGLIGVSPGNICVACHEQVPCLNDVQTGCVISAQGGIPRSPAFNNNNPVDVDAGDVVRVDCSVPDILLSPAEREALASNNRKPAITISVKQDTKLKNSKNIFYTDADDYYEPISKIPRGDRKSELIYDSQDEMSCPSITFYLHAKPNSTTGLSSSAKKILNTSVAGEHDFTIYFDQVGTDDSNKLCIWDQTAENWVNDGCKSGKISLKDLAGSRNVLYTPIDNGKPFTAPLADEFGDGVLKIKIASQEINTVLERQKTYQPNKNCPGIMADIFTTPSLTTSLFNKNNLPDWSNCLKENTDYQTLDPLYNIDGTLK